MPATAASLHVSGLIGIVGAPLYAIADILLLTVKIGTIRPETPYRVDFPGAYLNGNGGPSFWRGLLVLPWRRLMWRGLLGVRGYCHARHGWRWLQYRVRRLLQLRDIRIMVIPTEKVVQGRSAELFDGAGGCGNTAGGISPQPAGQR